MDPGHHIHSPAARAPIRCPNPDDPPPARPFHTSPVRRSSPLASQNGSVATSNNGRRRVHSVNPVSASASHTRSRRPISTSFGSSQTSSLREGMSSVMEDSGIGLFSDEYDLSHQDPRILQDVQRALKLKARREARLKSANSSPSSNKPDADSQLKPVSLLQPAFQLQHTSNLQPEPPLRPFFQPVPFPPPPISVISETEPIPIPSADRSTSSVVNHPIPTSSDEGTTLDWSGIGSEDDRFERRWTISISKRKEKEKIPSNSAVETRESMHTAKILQIRSKLSPRALEKASVASDQLSRRYNLVYNSLSTGTFNISKVARWFRSQEVVVQASLEQAEPFTWLQDVEKSRKSTQRIPWHLSALIMEEHILQLRGNSRPQINHHRIASLNSSPNVSISSQPPFPSPHGSSYFPLGPSLTRRLSYEGRISLEPLSETRRSIDRESRKSGESGYSSILSGSSLPLALVSPASSHFHLIPNPNRVESDNNSSQSEQSDDGRRKRPVVHPAPLSRDLLSSSTVKQSVRILPDLKPSLSSIPDDYKSPAEGPASSMDKASLEMPPTATGRAFGQRKIRISLPSGAAEALRLQLEKRRREDADEEQASREYELKQQLLDATIAQNNRVRQLLNHIAAGVREYDQSQTSLSTLLRVPYTGIPRELVDAFSHDPAAVTGVTRKYKSWRAVDDIYNRLARQRETFREFLSRSPDVDCFSTAESVLADPIIALMESLKTLDSERQDIAQRATEVSHRLKEVQTTHAQVKSSYNGTLSHTSVIYPEISTIVALEESYKDQYQYIWELAMDALTFVLDTVTPFWRTYGKTIGDDVQHFLIIPLYRNEFTGEAKRYTIDRFPRRSLRHWILLFLFFLGSVALTFLQARAALSSGSHLWLPWIPYPYLRRLLLTPFWISIMIQWWAVAVELSIVLTQLAVVVWWAGWYVNIFS